MTKKEHIEYWLNTSEKDYEVFLTLYDNNKYVYFFLHI